MTDVNECLIDNGGCDQNCTNTNGSFQCSCSTGYNLCSNAYCIGNVKLVLMIISLKSDIDECLREDICSHACHNTQGSYKCTCQTGYYLESDNNTCHG